MEYILNVDKEIIEKCFELSLVFGLDVDKFITIILETSIEMLLEELTDD